MKRHTSIDLLRAVAIFLVLGRHMEIYPGGHDLGSRILHWVSFHWNRAGWVGVDLFFVLSGFLVSGLLFRDLEVNGAVSPWNFLARRGLKIYPAFWGLLLFTAVRQLYHGEAPDIRFLSELLFVQCYVRAFWSHTWSLAVEEHFYLLLLLLFVLLTRERATRVRGIRLIPAVFGITACLCLAGRIRLWILGFPFDYYTYVFPTHLRIDSLFFGVLLAYYYNHHRSEFIRVCSRYRLACLGAGTAILSLSMFFGLAYTPWVYTVGFSLFYLASGLILMAMLVIDVSRLSWARGLAYIGSHSYSIYLWHMVVKEWLTPWVFVDLLGLSSPFWEAAFFILASLILGILFSVVLEYPVLRARDRWFPTRTPAPPDVPEAAGGD